MSVSDPTVAPGRWGGGLSPYGMSWQKMLMWWFIVSDFLIFVGFLAAYGFNRLAVGNANWPDRGEIFNMDFIAAMTFVLITSSATMATAVGAARKSDSKTAVRFLLLTILGGLCFLAMQAYEWNTFIGDGARLDTNFKKKGMARCVRRRGKGARAMAPHLRLHQVRGHRVKTALR